MCIRLHTASKKKKPVISREAEVLEHKTETIVVQCCQFKIEKNASSASQLNVNHGASVVYNIYSAQSEMTSGVGETWRYHYICPCLRDLEILERSQKRVGAVTSHGKRRR